jgi:predicted transcriptional regulator
MEMLRRLPEDTTFPEIVQHVRFMADVAAGIRDVEEGLVLSHAEVKRRLGVA